MDAIGDWRKWTPIWDLVMPILEAMFGELVAIRFDSHQQGEEKEPSH